ncbi:MAG TPA: methyltransferase domain-containing protein [Bacillales bacterium]|nr:methyltransferase domain-containing protein [Bacillales bacterium]
MKYDVEFLSLLKDANERFSGWDFSFLTETDRVQSGMLPWSYGSIVSASLPKANSMLDMGTGGGEFLSKLRPLPARVCATEGYAPNVPIAKGWLEPLGVEVFQVYEDEKLPFEDDPFDLIINRHESYSAAEVRRVLEDGGTFITQQVGGNDCHDINERLGAPFNDEFIHWNLEYAVNELKDHGFRVVDFQKHSPVQRFYDIGALVYYLKAIPWQIPGGFKVEDYLEKLYDIHLSIKEHGYFEVRQNRFIIQAE